MATIFKHKVVSNGVTFNEAVTVPAGAQAWGLDVMEGWKDTGDVEEFSTELGSYRDGVSSADFFPVRKRYVIVGGYVAATSEGQAEVLHDVLVRDAFPRNKVVTLTRYEGVPKQVTVRRASKFEVDWTAVQHGFRWQTTLLADDPLKYGLNMISGSGGISAVLATGHTFPVTFPMTFAGTGASGLTSIGMTNSGTAYSPRVVATLNGPLGKGAWRLTNETTGEFITFDVALLATDSLVIDFSARTATLNGFPVSSAYTGTFWKLAPGSNTIRLYAEPNATASVTIQSYSAWE